MMNQNKLTADDDSILRMLAGANFAPGASVILPSGITLNADEAQALTAAYAPAGVESDTAPYLCDGIAVGDQGQPYAECGLPKSHDPHPLNAGSYSPEVRDA